MSRVVGGEAGKLVKHGAGPIGKLMVSGVAGYLLTL